MTMWRPKMNRLRTVAVTVAFAAIAVGSTATHAQETGSTEHDVAVEGRTLHLACTGSRSPSVLFEAGGPDAAGGAMVVAQVGADVSAALGARFCAYDRAGTGLSPEDPIGVRTFREAAADLNALLASDELGCPCVVIGESLGGSIALVALAADPSSLAGLVLLDAPYPGYIDNELELASPDPEGTWLAPGENPEMLDIVESFRQVATPSEPLAIPITVVTHGAGDPPMACFPCPSGYPVTELEAAWQAGQTALAEALGAQLVVAENTGHSIAGENPGLVVQLVGEVIATVRGSDAPASVDESSSA